MAIKKTENIEVALKLIEQHGGKVDYLSKTEYVADVVVPNRSTLEIATKLGEQKEFRFVSPEIIA